MKIFVCVKQVPDTESKIKLKPDGSGIDEAGIKWIMNPYDEFAVEEAIRIKEKNPAAQITVVSLGPKSRVGECLRTALAMGADEGVLIHADGALDSLESARLLAKAIQSRGEVNLVLTGRLGIDHNASSVSQMLAEFLGVPHTTVVSKLTLEGSSVTAEREVEGGTREIVQMQLPCVVAANKGLNQPRYASLPGIMKAKKKPLHELEASSLGLDSSGGRVGLSAFALPKDKPPVKMVTGEAGQQAKELCRLLREESKVI